MVVYIIYIYIYIYKYIVVANVPLRSSYHHSSKAEFQQKPNMYEHVGKESEARQKKKGAQTGRGEKGHYITSARSTHTASTK